MDMYIVKKGDRLTDIAKKHYGDSSKYHEIASANHLINPDILYEGQTLRLPPVSPAESVKSENLEKSVYVVRYGDTLWKIAQKVLGNPQQWLDIAKLNNLKDPNYLLIGQLLKMPPMTLHRTEKAFHQEQQTINPASEPQKFNQKPATAIPGKGLFVIADEPNPFKPKLVRKDHPGNKGFQPKDMNSKVTIGRHVMGRNDSKFISASEHLLGAPRFKGTRYWIDVELLKKDGIKFYTREQIEADLKRIETKHQNNPKMGEKRINDNLKTLDKVARARSDMAMDREILIEGNIKPEAIKTAPSMALTRGAQFFQGVGYIMTAYELGSAAQESYQEKSIKPISKEVIRQSSGWGLGMAGSFAGRWAAMEAGFLAGAAISIETGPGAIIGGIIGSIIGGFFGYKAGDWAAGYLDVEAPEYEMVPELIP